VVVVHAASSNCCPSVHTEQVVQVLLDVAPVAPEYLPAPQGVHDDAPAPEYFPAPQGVQVLLDLASVAPEYLPAPHRVQLMGATLPLVDQVPALQRGGSGQGYC